MYCSLAALEALPLPNEGDFVGREVPEQLNRYICVVGRVAHRLGQATRG
jgi:hypothetical protein